MAGQSFAAPYQSKAAPWDAISSETETARRVEHALENGARMQLSACEALPQPKLKNCSWCGQKPCKGCKFDPCPFCHVHIGGEHGKHPRTGKGHRERSNARYVMRASREKVSASRQHNCGQHKWHCAGKHH